MLPFLGQITRNLSRDSCTRCASAGLLRFSRHSSTINPGSDETILRLVRRRMDERDILLSELTGANYDPARAKALSELEPLHQAWQKWMSNSEALRETERLLDDPDPNMRDLAQGEYRDLTEALRQQITIEMPTLAMPSSSTKHLSALIEIKSGVGGLESSLFLTELLQMYTRFSASKGWNCKIIDKTEIQDDTEATKDVILEVNGPGAYDTFQWESGVHRVQRVPITSKVGKIHTSAVAVIVLPYQEDGQAEEPLFDMADVTIEIMRSSGPGGQSVNKTESAVRLTHRPTGISVSMQDERNQHQNKRKAFRVLTARLMDLKMRQDMADRRALRRDILGSTADRSEKIRTYNVAQDRVTDHRVGVSVMNYQSVMDGSSLHTFTDALQKQHDAALLQAMLD